jgi:hypothetical protein
MMKNLFILVLNVYPFEYILLEWIKIVSDKASLSAQRSCCQGATVGNELKGNIMSFVEPVVEPYVQALHANNLRDTPRHGATDALAAAALADCGSGRLA